MKDSKILIDNILNDHKVHLAKDYDKYKNHVLRVYSLCLELDDSKENAEKYAIAAAFHDLAIWTNKTFNYLDPSISLAKDYLKAIDKDEMATEIGIMIDMHHKRSKYKGEFAKTVEIFRRADWIDVTIGKKLFGLQKTVYSNIKDQYPTLGFHRFLVKQTIKNLFKSPLNPLPMFKK